MIYFIDAIRKVQEVTYFHFVRNNMHVCYTLCTEYVAHQYSKQSRKGRRKDYYLAHMANGETNTLSLFPCTC